jgi:hypothetical protein
MAIDVIALRIEVCRDSMADDSTTAAQRRDRTKAIGWK